MIRTKKSKKKLKHEEALELRHNAGLSIGELASCYRKSERTIYRWLSFEKQRDVSVCHRSIKKRSCPRKYSSEIYNRIVEFKKEVPQRSAPIIWNLLKKEFPTTTPSLSLIRKYLREQGLTFKSKSRKQGYVEFERKKPNDLWQIDVAGV